MNKFTKIVATIGPSSSPVPMLTKMVQSGLNVARINFSHGTHESNGEAIKNVKIVSQKTGIPVAILADLQGPKIRVGNIPAPIPIKAGQKLVIGEDFPMDFDITGSVRPGERLLIEDGLIEFKILKVVPTNGKALGKIYCEVVNGDAIRPRKSMNLPDTKTTFPIITEKDLKDLKFALTQDVDYVAMSFVRGPEDVVNLRKLIKKYLPKGFVEPKVMVKIEIPSAVERFDEILAETDSVMVARGDLGVELPPAKVPVVQKEIVRKCREAAKPVIVATQMLDSMINNPRPTRAEVSDVANAVLDGADAVMLSGETSTGNYPLECIEMMAGIIREVENSDLSSQYVWSMVDQDKSTVAGSACDLAEGLEAFGIATFSATGDVARFLSQQRTLLPIYLLSSSKEVLRWSSLLWGVSSIQSSKLTRAEEVMSVLQKQKLCKKGDKMVVLSGQLQSGAPSSIQVFQA